MSHNIEPADIISGIKSEISLASLSFQMRIIWGSRENVVKIAAI